MVRLVGVYVLRCWQTRDDVPRIEIVRVQDGSRIVVSKLDEAAAWLRTQSDTAGSAQTENRDVPQGNE